MKLLLVLSFIVVAAHAAPNQAKHQWEMVPDAEGTLRMVDLSTYEAEPGPQFNADTDVIFYLFTRSNPTVGQIIGLNNAPSLVASNFNAAHPTRFTIHGWHGDVTHNPNVVLASAYLSRGDFNVIAVDWGAGAQTINYIAARNAVGDVGRVVAQFTEFLISIAGININHVYIAGHSLGGHVAGFAGKHTQGRMHTIFGLDAAGPLFSINEPTERLAATDAQYVESIITNGGTLGLWGHSGDTTFFPNGGSSQPGCGIDAAGVCAHERSNFYMAESIITGQSRFFAMSCETLAQVESGVCVPTGPGRFMGGEPSNHGQGASGLYRLHVNSDSPFAMG